MYETHNQLMVIARRIFQTWKQLFYFQFDAKITNGVFNDIVIAIEEANFAVAAAVSDLGGQRPSQWYAYDVQHVIPYRPSREIFCFVDAPHLLKLLRNPVLDTGFILPSGDSGKKNAATTRRPGL